MAMTVLFFAVRIAIIPIYWYKVYSIMDSQLWTKMRHFRYIMIVTCVILDIINIFWFNKMFRSALIVLSTNWEYYEKHHKSQQLRTLSAYQRQLRHIFWHKIIQCLIKINHGKYIGTKFIENNVNMPKVLGDLLNKNPK